MTVNDVCLCVLTLCKTGDLSRVSTMPNDNVGTPVNLERKRMDACEW